MEDKLRSMNIIFFDGVCGLCNSTVNILISLDKNRKFHFAPLQGTTAQKLLGPSLVANLDSLILWEKGRVLKKYAAVMRILFSLGLPWSILWIFRLFPNFIGDLFYNAVAALRYKLFGKLETCRLPSLEEKDLFLD